MDERRSIALDAGRQPAGTRTRRATAAAKRESFTDAAPAKFLSRDERVAEGKALRDKVPREAHASFKTPSKGRDPIALLEKSNRDRLPELVPIRYGRMLRSPFTFLRGSAGVMASDLATTPSSGVRVQACGDCHLSNFGMFATPERNLVFDINDFDETLPAPWEWDVKRLAASFVVAARDNRCSADESREAAVECVRAYREHLRECSKKSPLDVWYERLDTQSLIERAPDARARKTRAGMAAKARQRIGEFLLPRISTGVSGRRRLIDQPPVLFHVPDDDAEARFRAGLEDYRLSLPDDRRVLFDRYHFEDVALKVVGIGSVGTRCYVALLFSDDGHPLILQFKEACTSVLAPYAGKSVYENQGQRIVVGQRLMQSSSDIFLGWAHSHHRFHFFGRQLRDMKFAIPIEGASAAELKRYAGICGIVLARAHARSGDAARISGYLGKSDVFDQAVGQFAVAYSQQTVRDHAALIAAVKSGRIDALVETDL
ncbi:MAG TPA: DUF2252 domain-containing protein [Casimicrobiaceae bacterium]|nr:DUF2252 domain-containing protein [Casimicrobiaceae bacterium]